MDVWTSFDRLLRTPQKPHTNWKPYEWLTWEIRGRENPQLRDYTRKFSFRYDFDTWTVDRFLLSTPVSIYWTLRFFLQTRSIAISYTLITKQTFNSFCSSLFIVENVLLWWKLWMRLCLQVRKWLWRVSNLSPINSFEFDRVKLLLVLMILWRAWYLENLIFLFLLYRFRFLYLLRIFVPRSMAIRSFADSLHSYDDQGGFSCEISENDYGVHFTWG